MALVKNLRPRDGQKERGASAVVIALCMVVIAAGCAFALDIANLSFRRQALQNTIDASAQAGTSYLPGDPTGARAAALNFAAQNQPGLVPTVELLCIVGNSDGRVTAGHIPATCDPTGGPVQQVYAGMKCTGSLCAIPCDPVRGRCNSLRVTGTSVVDYWFAPILGINQGSTGAISSTSCKGACGTLMPNAMDIAIVADRTGSMSDRDLELMRQGIRDSLATMTPEYQFATLVPIHKSAPTAACATTQAGGPSGVNSRAARNGVWMPLGYSNDFLNGSLGDTTRTVNPRSELVRGIACFNKVSNYTGTHLAAPMKAATRSLLGMDPSNLATLSANRARLLPHGATVTKAILFETDGVPEETIGDPRYDRDAYRLGLGTTNINVAGDIGGGNAQNFDPGCTNFLKVAEQAKARGILVITVAFGGATIRSCNGRLAAHTLAAAASPTESGPSRLEHDCTTPRGADAENSDGDYFYCAATGDQLKEIFVSAIARIGGNTRFVNI